MKKYRIREGSFLATAIPMAVFILLIVVSGLGNHFIDGI